MVRSFESKKVIGMIAVMGLLAFPIVLGYILFSFHMRALDLQQREERVLHERYVAHLFQSIIEERLNKEVFTAKAVAVYDLVEQKYIFKKNTDQIFGIASLTKIMTAVAALEVYPPETIFTLSAKALAQSGEEFFQEGQKWSLFNLIAIMLMQSSNDAAYALRESYSDFLEYMNTKADLLNMHDTEFLNATGLDLDGGILGAKSSIDDLVSLVQYVYSTHPDIIYGNLATTKRDFSDHDNNYYTGIHTHIGIESIQHILFSKTGYTALAGGTLLSVVKYPEQHPLVLVVLGSTFNDRFTDIEILVEVIKDTYLLLDDQMFYPKKTQEFFL